MKKNFWCICTAVFLLVVMIFFWTRYQTVPGSHGFYKINRLTGETSFVRLGMETSVVRSGPVHTEKKAGFFDDLIPEKR